MYNNSIKHQSFVYTQLNDPTVLFLTIQFSVSYCLHSVKYQTVLFDPQIRPYQVLPPQARVDQRAMAIKLYVMSSQSASITGASPSDYLMLYPGQSFGWGSYSTAEMQSVYSTAPGDWAGLGWAVQGSKIYQTKGKSKNDMTIPCLAKGFCYRNILCAVFEFYCMAEFFVHD